MPGSRGAVHYSWVQYLLSTQVLYRGYTNGWWYPGTTLETFRYLAGTGKLSQEPSQLQLSVAALAHTNPMM